MKFCAKCGAELLDDAVMCTGCGSTVENNNCSGQMEGKTLHKKPKIKIIWIALAAVLLVGIIALILFMPRNLKLDDIKQTNVVTAILQYGIPESIVSDEDGIFLRYGDKVDFYGITPYSFAVYPEENEVVFFFLSDDGREVYDKISRYCDLEDRGLVFHDFSYDNLYITTYAYDGGYVSIEID